MPSEPWRAFLQLLCYCFCCLAIMMGKLYIRYLTPCQHKDQQAVLSMWDLWARTWQEACPTPPLEGLSGSCSVPECNLGSTSLTRLWKMSVARHSVKVSVEKLSGHRLSMVFFVGAALTD